MAFIKHLGLATLGVALISAPLVQGQLEPTIPEILVRAGKSMSGFETVPSGPAPTVSDVLRNTDMAVRGIVGGARSYLSADQREIYTDYSLLRPSVLYQADVTRSARPGVLPAVTVTARGGTVNVNGLTYTFKVMALPPLELGSDCLFLLDKIGDRYMVAGVYYGVFRVSSGTLTPLTKKSDYAPEYRGAAAEPSILQIVGKLHELRDSR
jgi:hypothetical protein